MEREDRPRRVLPDRAEHPHHHGHAHRDHTDPQVGAVPLEDHRVHPVDRVDRHLGVQPGEQRGHRGGGVGVGPGQPAVHRDDGGLDRQGDQHDRHRRRHQFGFGGQPGQLPEVDGARHPVDEADAGEEHRRGQQVHRHVQPAGPHPPDAGEHRQQPVRGQQHHLDEDEQVEQVRREQRPVHTRRQDEDQRREEPAFLVTRGDRERRTHQCQQRGHHDHQGAEHVPDERDADPVRPETDVVRDDAAVPAGDDEQDTEPEAQRARSEQDHPAR